MWQRESDGSTFTCFIDTHPDGWRLTLTVDDAEAVTRVVEGEEEVFAAAAAWLCEWCEDG
jgi:hypothetical protein